MIDLAAVAARIVALPGWSVNGVFCTDDDDGEATGTYLSVSFNDDDTVFVDESGAVTGASYDDDLMLLLPVLQIVAEARGE